MKLDPRPAFCWSKVPATEDALDDLGVRCDLIERDGAVEGE